MPSGPTTAFLIRVLICGTYKQLSPMGLVSWETAQDIAAVEAPDVQKNA